MCIRDSANYCPQQCVSEAASTGRYAAHIVRNHEEGNSCQIVHNNPPAHVIQKLALRIKEEAEAVQPVQQVEEEVQEIVEEEIAQSSEEE